MHFLNEMQMQRPLKHMLAAPYFMFICGQIAATGWVISTSLRLEVTIAFSALTLLVGHQEESIQPAKIE